MHTQMQDNILTKKEKESSKLRLCGGSWSINLSEIKELTSINKVKVELIRYVTASHTYEILYEEALAKGFIRTFQGETKLIVPIKYWITI